MNTIQFEGETSFYNISNLEYNMRWDNMILRLGLLDIYIYIGDKGLQLEWKGAKKGSNRPTRNVIIHYLGHNKGFYIYHGDFSRA